MKKQNCELRITNYELKTNRGAKRVFFYLFCLFSCVFLCGSIFLFSFDFKAEKVSAADVDGEIEKAMFTRQEFFGADAIVPLPASQARENLSKLAENLPDNPQILEKLANANEKSENFDEAEKNLSRLSEINSSKLGALADFYERRGEFAKSAEVLRKILLSAKASKRGEVFERLINLARIHELKNYLNADFYRQIAEENPNLYSIFEKLIANLEEEKNYADALNLARQAEKRFPERKNILLGKEVDILGEMGESGEAETVYRAAFDPLWSEDDAQKFYDFLSRQDHLRAYGAEMKERFKKNPADFDAAIRLALYQDHDYSYGNDSALPVISKMEEAKNSWTTEELVIISRLLLKENETATASRFLYTLYAREDFQKDSALRAQVLYQIFEMFCEAGSEKLPISRGDLRFYEDVAKADTEPGIATGILSLVFSDTNPAEKLNAQETKATKYFNRAAAYKIFDEYKKENPKSPELAQMQLDLIRIYTNEKETEIAAKLLDEFAANYQNTRDFTDAAMKLADAFAIAEKPEKTREIYQKVLDYLGKNSRGKLKIDTVKTDDETTDANDETTDANNGNPTTSNGSGNGYGSADADDAGDEDGASDDEETPVFEDYLGEKRTKYTYADVLEKLVASLAGEKKTAEILTLYSNEIGKYPNEQWLYEQRLARLEQTNLVDEQLAVYKEAVKRFQTNDWRDKLARFFLRQQKETEFAEFSEEIVGSLTDAETSEYLLQNIDGKINSGDFDELLYFKLYQSAHRRFPHNVNFVNGLLRYYTIHKKDAEWRKLSAEYYFESKEIRETFLDELAKKSEIRNFLAQANGQESLIYELFRADAAARLSDYENAVAAYRKLNQIYPHTPEFSARLISLTRSFGQRNRDSLTEAGYLAKSDADFQASSAAARTTSGEIYAELGNYEKADAEWQKLIQTASGERETYLDTATVYWDYFQYDEALQTIQNLRGKFDDETLYAFEAGTILEARQKEKDAVGEYVKAVNLGDETQETKALKRLRFLALNDADEQTKGENLQTINAAFETSERGKDRDSATLGYAKFLAKIKQNEKAETILNAAVRRSSDADFVEQAQLFYESEEIDSGDQIALEKLSEISENPRRKIQTALQAVESYETSQNPQAAKNVLAKLVVRFPNNYGVLTETADFYKRLGYQSDAAVILQNALPRSRGVYKTRLSSKLAALLTNLDREQDAEHILIKLHDENPADTDVFRELAKICVRTNNAELMRKAFAETVAEIKKSDADRRELEPQIAALRTEMIDAFTRLNDYKSAIEQHIEIINREPDDDEATENAVAYVKRYGGAETLLNYYLKLSAEAFKNYRWNVVLARIYAANRDDENALKNYQAAIINQPEMPELYKAVADIETKRGNFDAALQNIDEVLKLTNDAPENIKKKIEILKKAGRETEIAAEKAKLPAEAAPKPDADKFAEAQRLSFTEKEKARQIYREAFDNLLQNPLSGELKTSNITGYAQTIREEEPLDRINEKLWNLRGKLIEIADETNGKNAGEARKRLEILDGAIIEAVGGAAKNFGTNEELAALHTSLQTKIGENSFASDTHQTLSNIQNFSRRAGFGDLEETILQKRLDESFSIFDREIYIRNLLNFYNERGAYQKSFDLLEKYGTSDFAQKAEAARIVGSKEKELEALRAIYWKRVEKTSETDDANVRHYLEILEAENRGELQSLTEKNSPRQLQLINFLIGKGERDLAHAAIKNSAFPNAWKVSRSAETSLALGEFEESAECYFCDALQFDTTGNLIRQTPEKQRFLINDDWFRLTREYGEWLDRQQDNTVSPSKFLPAMTENLPDSGAEQFKLGEYYLRKKDLPKAVEHLKLAIEVDNSAEQNKLQLATLAAAYFLAGKTDFAEECRARIFAGEDAGNDAQTDNRTDVSDALLYAQTLQSYGLHEQSREKLPPVVIQFLANSDADKSEEFQNLIRAVAASIGGEADRAAYFQAILNKRPTDASLAEMILNENLVDADHADFFYRRIVENKKTDAANYDYNSIYQRVWQNSDDAESVYELENNYRDKSENKSQYDYYGNETETGDGDVWRQKYLDFLLDRNENAKAWQLIQTFEKQMKGKNLRPAWLRAAKINLEIRGGKIDESEIERFTGIAAAGSATEIVPPNVERFNEIRQILLDAKQANAANYLSLAFFGRMLALEQFETANFDGAARAFFEKGDEEKAFTVLNLLIKAADLNQNETAFAEINALDFVKTRRADAKKLPKASDSPDKIDALKAAAEVSDQFGQTEKAVEFRREIFQADDKAVFNRLELAKLLIKLKANAEAFQMLNEIAADRASLRSERWQALKILRESGENVEFPNIDFDVFSQFHAGEAAENFNQNETAENFFINALIADKDAETAARQELIKTYALHGKYSAALKFAETDKSPKSDEILRMLSEAAEKTGNYARAIEFEKAKSAVNTERIELLQNLETEKNRRATDFTVNADNTGKL